MTVTGWLVLAFVGVLGLLIGSFLNAVIYRLPRECMSVVRQPRSRCPRCGVQLAWYDNLPVFSYTVLLRGRCRSCHEPISARYPLIELFVALSFVGLALFDVGTERFEDPLASGQLWLIWAVHSLIVSTLIVLSVIDWEFRILPDVITIPGVFLALLLVFLVPEVMPRPVFFQDTGWSLQVIVLMNGLVGAAVGGGGLFVIGWLGEKAFRKPAMGLGDVKLSAAMGGVLGLWYLAALVLACFLGSIVGLLVLALTRERYVPFGPFLAVGMVVTFLWGPGLYDTVTEVLLLR